MYGLNFENVNFAYNGSPVLKNINMLIPAGEFLVIMGPNGSGKSTLLKLAAGLLEPQSGTVTIEGIPVREFRKCGKMGFVPQNYGRNAVFPANVEEIVHLGLASQPGTLSRSASKPVIEQMLCLVGLENIRKRRFAELSGGQQQRVMIARALAGSPGILLLDEPTSGIDQEASSKIYELLKQLNSSLGITIIMVSHDIEKATKWASKAACINYGLCYFGDSKEFRAHHSQSAHPWYYGA